MAEAATGPTGSGTPSHSVPVFEGRSSRRHEDRSIADLREQAAALRDATPDLGQVHTLLQFAGFPRSGHSLVGSLLDAHPDAVVSHELDLMGLVEHGLDRQELLTLLCANSAEFEDNGRSWNGYSYQVPHGSGGASHSPLVLGDKKADWAVRRTLRTPSLLGRLDALVPDLRQAWVVVLRNPFDNVATLSLRRGRAYDRIRINAADQAQFERRLQQAKGSRITDEVLPDVVDDYASLCDGVARMKEQVRPEDWCELRHEDLVAEPERSLARLLEFAGLSAPTDFVASAATLVSTTVNATRHQLAWPERERARTQQLVERHSFLEGYRFDDH